MPKNNAPKEITLIPVEGLSETLHHYASRIVQNSLDYKFVRVATIKAKNPKWNEEKEWPESWAGNWIINGEEHFLTSLHHHPKDGFYIWTHGTDDTLFRSRYYQSESEARTVYEQIINGTSIEELHFFFNFQY